MHAHLGLATVRASPSYRQLVRGRSSGLRSHGGEPLSREIGKVELYRWRSRAAPVTLIGVEDPDHTRHYLLHLAHEALYVLRHVAARP